MRIFILFILVCLMMAMEGGEKVMEHQKEVTSEPKLDHATLVAGKPRLQSLCRNSSTNTGVTTLRKIRSITLSEDGVLAESAAALRAPHVPTPPEVMAWNNCVTGEDTLPPPVAASSPPRPPIPDRYRCLERCIDEAEARRILYHGMSVSGDEEGAWIETPLLVGGHIDAYYKMGSRPAVLIRCPTGSAAAAGRAAAGRLDETAPCLGSSLVLFEPLLLGDHGQRAFDLRKAHTYSICAYGCKIEAEFAPVRSFGRGEPGKRPPPWRCHCSRLPLEAKFFSVTLLRPPYSWAPPATMGHTGYAWNSCRHSACLIGVLHAEDQGRSVCGGKHGFLSEKIWLWPSLSVRRFFVFIFSLLFLFST